MTSGGAIPDLADYQVVLQPAGVQIGTVHEDFAVESLAGDVFQLGNASWRILKVEQGKVLVEDAKGSAAEHPLLAGRGPGADGGAVAGRVAAAGRGGAAGAGRPAGRGGVAGRRAGARSGRRHAARGLPGRRRPGPGGHAEPGDAGGRALLRRGGGHAPRDARAVRQPAEPGLGARSAQALLPDVQLRASGRGHRRRHRALARAHAQLPAGRRFPLPALQHGAGRAHAGRARRTALRRALAVERRPGARHPPSPGGPEGAGAAAAAAGGGSGGRGLPGPARLPGEHRGRARGPRSSPGRTDPPGLPGRGHGRRRAGGAPPADRGRRGRADSPRRGGALAAGPRDPEGPAVRLPGRRAPGGAADAGGLPAPLARSGDGVGPGRAGRGRHPPGARGGVARGGDAGRAPRRPDDARLRDGGGRGPLRLEPVLRRSCRGTASHGPDAG